MGYGLNATGHVEDYDERSGARLNASISEDARCDEAAYD